jgi:hypothetical protein
LELAASKRIAWMPAFSWRAASSAAYFVQKGVLRLQGQHLLLQEVALLRRELAVRRQVHHQRDLGVVEAGVDAVLGLLLPVQVEDAADGPAVAVDHAAFQRGVDLARRGGDHVGVEGLEEVAVHGGDADLQPGQVRLAHRLVHVDVEGLVLHHPPQVLHVALLVPHLVDRLPGAVPALLRDRHLRELEEVRLGHHVGVERAGGHRHVHHAGLHRVADFERGNGPRAADEVDLQEALALGVELLDPGLQALHVDAVLGEGAHEPEGDFLRGRSPGEAGGEQGGRSPHEGASFHGLVSLRWGRH